MSLILSKSDRDSQVFRKLMKYYAERLQLLRAQNDGDLDKFKTDTHRGRIQEVKALLALNEDQPKLE